jgi:hypothetical protein
MKLSKLSLLSIMTLLLMSVPVLSQTTTDTRSLAEVQASLKKNIKKYNTLPIWSGGTVSSASFNGCAMTISYSGGQISSGIAASSDGISNNSPSYTYIDFDLKDIDANKFEVTPFATASALAPTYRRIMFSTLSGSKGIKYSSSGVGDAQIRTDKAASYKIYVKMEGAESVYQDMLRATHLCQNIK